MLFVQYHNLEETSCTNNMPRFFHLMSDDDSSSNEDFVLEEDLGQDMALSSTGNSTNF